MTSPEPDTAADPFLTRMVTTDGNSFPATVVALHALAPDVVETDGSLPPLEQPAVIAAAMSANTRAAASQPRRLRRPEHRSASAMRADHPPASRRRRHPQRVTELAKLSPAGAC